MTKQYNVMGMVRLRQAGSASGNTGQLSVPAALMQFLEIGALYKPEFTDEGILYRFVGADDAAVLSPPAWTRNGTEENA